MTTTNPYLRPLTSPTATMGWRIVEVPGFPRLEVDADLAAEIQRLMRVGDIRSAVTLLLWFGAEPLPEGDACA